MKSPIHGFSLVELSIVLVILGLLTGGILTGQSLIRAAELRAVSTEYQRYGTAVHTFRDRYMALPGDMHDAVRFWGAQLGGTADGIDTGCATTTVQATGLPTCNGNGNGLVGDNSITHENMRFWQHLANAGLIEGSYAGVFISGFTLRGVNAPASRLSPASYAIQSLHNETGNATDFPAQGHAFWFGKDADNHPFPGRAVLTPEEAWNLDTKLDDGRPGYGMVMSWRVGSGVPDCTTSDASLSPAADAAQAHYNLTLRSVACAVRLFLK